MVIARKRRVNATMKGSGKNFAMTPESVELIKKSANMHGVMAKKCRSVTAALIGVTGGRRERNEVAGLTLVWNSPRFNWPRFPKGTYHSIASLQY